MIDQEKDDVQNEPEAAVSAEAFAIGQPEEADQAVASEGEQEGAGTGEPLAEAEPTEARPRIILKRSGAETDQVFDVNPPATIGRFDPAVGPIDVDLGPLDEGRYVSRKHAKITCEDGVWKLVDLGSSNGTFVLRSDFEKIDEVELTDGCEFALGNARFVFRLA